MSFRHRRKHLEVKYISVRSLGLRVWVGVRVRSRVRVKIRAMV
jgi:hypothetical protein